MLKRSIRPAAVVGALAVAAASAVLSLTPASATVVGTATLSQPTGNALSLLRISTSGPCSTAGATKYKVNVTGFGLPDSTGYNLIPPTNLGFSSTEPILDRQFALAFVTVAQENGSTPLIGKYDVRFQCINSLGNVKYDEYETSMWWTTPGNSFANIESATFTTVAPNTAFTLGGAPTVASNPKVGVMVTATPGSFVPVPSGLAYQWLRGGAPIGGATTSTYTPSAADAGEMLSVRTTATKPGVTSLSATSAARRVAPGTLVATKNPTTSGKAKVGKKLTAVKGAWSPVPTSYSYQWQRGGKNISKATKSVYKLTSKDKKKKVRVKVTVKKAGYTTVVKYSAPRKVR